MQNTEYGFLIKNKYLDLDGNIIKRDPDKYPYSFDEFVTWKLERNIHSGDLGKCNIVYSNRLLEWDREKYNKCCEEVFGNTGQFFYDRDPKDIETFLSKYFGEEIVLKVIIQGCNYSNGYHYWKFYYEKKESETTVNFKTLLELYDNWNGKTRVNDNNLIVLLEDKTVNIYDNRKDLFDKEVVSFGFYDDVFTVRLK